jgi:hypothetical protein
VTVGLYFRRDFCNLTHDLFFHVHSHLAGKTTLFVANQANIDVMPAEQLAAIEAEQKSLVEENNLREAQVKALSVGM